MFRGWQIWVFRVIAMGALALAVWCGYLALVANAGPGYVLLGVPLIMIVMWCEVELDRASPGCHLWPWYRSRSTQLELVDHYQR